MGSYPAFNLTMQNRAKRIGVAIEQTGYQKVSSYYLGQLYPEGKK